MVTPSIHCGLARNFAGLPSGDHLSFQPALCPPDSLSLRTVLFIHMTFMGVCMYVLAVRAERESMCGRGAFHVFRDGSHFCVTLRHVNIGIVSENGYRSQLNLRCLRMAHH